MSAAARPPLRRSPPILWTRPFAAPLVMFRILPWIMSDCFVVYLCRRGEGCQTGPRAPGDLVLRRCEEPELFLPGEPLDPRLLGGGRAPRVPSGNVDHAQGPPAPEVPCPATSGVKAEASPGVGAAPGVEGAVGAENDVDLPPLRILSPFPPSAYHGGYSRIGAAGSPQAASPRRDRITT